MSRLVLCLLWLLMLFAPAAAKAQLRETPADVLLDGAVRLSVPPLPDGFVRRSAGTLAFEMPAAAESTVQPILDTAATEWVRVCTDLGAPLDVPLLVRFGTNPDEMASLAPPEAPPPDYAVGVAYPEVDLVVLTLTAPETWERPELRQVFTHELAHVALHRAVSEGGITRPLPRWFDEGVAVHEAGERSMERVEVLWQGTVSGQLIPLRDLDGFPGRPHEVSLAYAESADFVAWLLRRGDDGPAKLREVLQRVRGGLAFEPAVSLTFSTSLSSLEDEWREGLSQRYTLAPLLLGGGLAWVLVGVLVVLAFRKRRTTHKKTLDRWQEEERIEDEREALRARAREILRARRELTTPAQVAAGATATPPATEDEQAEAPLYDRPPPPPPTEVPTIEWDGGRHTLH
jgi:hypothetical protein